MQLTDEKPKITVIHGDGSRWGRKTERAIEAGYRAVAALVAIPAVMFLGVGLIVASAHGSWEWWRGGLLAAGISMLATFVFALIMWASFVWEWHW